LTFQGYYVAQCTHALPFPASVAMQNAPRNHIPNLPTPPREQNFAFRPKLLPRGSRRHSPHPFGRFGSLTGGLMTTGGGGRRWRPNRGVKTYVSATTNSVADTTLCGETNIRFYPPMRPIRCDLKTATVDVMALSPSPQCPQTCGDVAKSQAECAYAHERKARRAYASSGVVF